MVTSQAIPPWQEWPVASDRATSVKIIPKETMITGRNGASLALMKANFHFRTEPVPVDRYKITPSGNYMEILTSQSGIYHIYDRADIENGR